MLRSLFALIIACFWSGRGIASAEEALLPQAEICAQIRNVGHFFQKPGEEPNCFSFFVEVKSLKTLSGGTAGLIAPGQTTTFRIHSPSRMFAVEESQLRGQIFKLSLVENDGGWMLTRAAKADKECGDQGALNGSRQKVSVELREDLSVKYGRTRYVTFKIHADKTSVPGSSRLHVKC